MTANNIFRTSSSTSDSVFIEKDHHLQIHQMKKILSSGSTHDIKNFFFTSTSSDLNISGVTQNQIRKHSEVLNHRNKNYLKHLLRQRKQNGEKVSELKAFNQQKTNYEMDQGDGEIQQYLSLNEGFEFGEFREVL